MYNCSATAAGICESKRAVERLLMEKRLLRMGVLALAVSCSMAIAGTAPPRDDKPLSTQEMRALVERVAANQHLNDAALAEYERREHRTRHKEETDERAEEDKVFRVVPTGTGTLRLILEDRGRPVSRDYYWEQLRELEKTLVWALNPDEPKQRPRVQKWNRRVKERAETVDAVREAFVPTWLGRETRGGRQLLKLQLDPDPRFNATSRTTEMFAHLRAVIWVEPVSAQLVRVEAEVVRDIAVGGGVLGKVYRGGKFVMEQAEVADGVWLPMRIQYNFKGRKFVFGFEMHEVTETARYARIGPPQTALAAIRRELNDTPSGNSSQ